jgi:hypothetical protein
LSVLRVGEVLVDVEHIVVIVAAAITAIAAVLGVNTWRRQLRGQAHYEVARGALRAVYRVWDSVALVRSPFMSSGEMAAAIAEVEPDPKNLQGETDEARIRAVAAGYQVRWRAVASAMSDLDLARVEAEALWGTEAAECLAAIRKCVHELNAALTMYLRRQRNAWRGGASANFDEGIERIVFGAGEDEFQGKVRAAVETAEAFFRPTLELKLKLPRFRGR